MPNKQSAKKALRQKAKRTALNQMYRKRFQEAIKQTIRAKSEKEAGELIRLAQKALDKAAKHGTIKKNAAGRKLSRLAAKIRTKFKK